MAEYKKGGLTGNSNLYATNRLFVKNPLFKKRKKKAPGVYDPTAKFRYKEGGVSKDPSIPELTKAKDGGNPGDPFLKRLISQIKKGNESKKPAPSLTRKAPKQPTSNSFSNKSLLNKEIQQQRNRNKTLEQTFPEVEIIGKRPITTIHGEIPDSFTEDLIEFVDPTGISSWDDIASSYEKHGLFSPQTGLEIAGAIPLVGKIGKSGKVLAGGEKLFLNYVKNFGWNDKIAKAYNTYRKTGGKELDYTLGLTTRGLMKTFPKLDPQKWSSSENVINNLNRFTNAARASKFLPYTPSGDTQQPVGDDAINEKKNGGVTDEYIEIDIPEEKIQWYIDNGYRVEPVSKLKKFIG